MKTSRSLRAVPGVVWGSIACWALLALCVLAAASVPAYRLPWTLTTTLHEVSPGSFVSDPIAGLQTPYISFVRVRLPRQSSSADGVRISLLEGNNARRLTQFENVPIAPREGDELEWQGPAIQLPPTRILTLMAKAPGAGENGRAGSFIIGYDGKSPAVRVVTYWWPWLLSVFLGGTWLLLIKRGWGLQERVGQQIASFLKQPAMVAIIAASILIRLALVWRGGQYFDWDENRYQSGVGIFELLSTGNLRAAAGILLTTPDHPLFRLVAIGPAFFQVVSAFGTGHALADARHPAGEWLAASVLSLFSVISIVLVYAIARRAGGSRREGTIAMLLMAASGTILIHARHLFPYDAAMAVALLALWIGLTPDDRPRHSIAAGVIASLGFLIYTGYWLIAALVVTLHVFHGRASYSTVCRRGFLSAIGLSIPLAVLLAAAAFTSHPLGQEIVATSRGITSGVFAEAWSLPWTYFWYAQPGITLVSLAGIAAALWNRSAQSARRACIWLLAALGIYAGLIAGANVFHRFVVYERLAKQMIPFLCLASAAGWTTVWPERSGRGWWPAIGAAIVATLFVVDVLPLWRQQFPREIVMSTVQRYGAEHVALARTVLGASDATAALFLPLEPPNADGTGEGKRYVVLNGYDIWPETDRFRAVPPPPGAVVFSTPHPRQLRALQFQGFTPTQRAYLRTTDVSIRVIDTQQGH